MTAPEVQVSPHSHDRWYAPSPQGGSLTVIYHDEDEIADSLGHLGALKTHIRLGTLDDAFKKPTAETAETIFNRWKEEPWKNHVELHIGGAPGLEAFVERVLYALGNRMNQAGEEHDHQRSKHEFLKKKSFAYTILKTALASQWLNVRLHRIDHFNAGTSSGVVYHPNAAIAMHELGHAAHYDIQKDPSKEVLLYLLPGFRSYQEWQASKEAMKRIPLKEDRDAAMKILEPALGGYIGDDIARIIKGISPALALTTPTIGFFVGHLTSRLPFRRGSFGVPLKS